MVNAILLALALAADPGSNLSPEGCVYQEAARQWVCPTSIRLRSGADIQSPGDSGAAGDSGASAGSSSGDSGNCK